MVFIPSTCSRITSRVSSRIWRGAMWRWHVCHLKVDSVVWLSHMSSIWPWSLGWEIRLEFCGIPRLIWFRTVWTPEFSLEFYFSDCKMCSHQFWRHFFRFGILSRQLFFQFHESENVPAIFVSGRWHQILILNAPTLFTRTIANPLLTISTWYTQIYENLIDV